MKKYLVLVGLALSTLSAQQWTVTESYDYPSPFKGITKIDQRTGSLVMYTDVSVVGAVGAALYGRGTGQYDISISPLKDFSGAKQVQIWDAAEGMNRTVVLASLIVYPNKDVRRVILTYGSDGSLKKLWDVEPYFFKRVAVDEAGNVYGFGRKINLGETPQDPDYYMVMKYSPDGTLLAEGLKRSSTVPYAADEFHRQGQNRFWFANGKLRLYSGAAGQVFTFDPADLREVSRISLTDQFASLAKNLGLTYAQVLELGIDSGENIVAQFHVWTEEKNVKNKIVLARISPSGTLSILKTSDFVRDPVFLGLSSGDKLNALVVDDKGGRYLQRGKF